MKKILSILEVIEEEEKLADHMQDKEKMTFNQKYLKSKKQPMATDDGLVNKSISDVKNSLKEQACPEGQAWCPIHKKCIPEDQRPGRGKHFGKGKGPIGNPKQEQKIDDLVDEVFEEGFDKLKQMITLEKQVDDILDKVGPRDEKSVVKVRVSPTMQGGIDVRIAESEILDILQNLKEDNNYKVYFKSKLLRSGYKSIKDMPDDVKKNFFNSVDKGWKAQNEGSTGAAGAAGAKAYAPVIAVGAAYAGYKGIKALKKRKLANAKKKKVAKEELNEFGAITMGLAGGAAGLIANHAICNRRFPTVKIRQLQKVAYGKCLRNPFRGTAKKGNEPKQCIGIREKIKALRAYTGKCQFKYKGDPKKIEKCISDTRRVKAGLVANKKNLNCF